ncbi:MAG TPA: hypothetical protein EYH39_03390 [Desulfurobacteriaceae bacterium]|nr:hypothetical protein [Desulfurobacteriaceae bacterium]
MLKKFFDYLLDKKISEFGILDIGSYCIKYAEVNLFQGDFLIKNPKKVYTFSISKGWITDGKIFENEINTLIRNTNIKDLFIILPLSNFQIKGKEEVTIPYDFGVKKYIDINLFKDLYLKFKEDKNYLFPDLYTSHLCPYEFTLDGQKVKNILSLSGRYLEVKAYPFFLKNSYTIETIKELFGRKKLKIRHFLAQNVCYVSNYLKDNLMQSENLLLINFGSSGVEVTYLKNNYIAWSFYSSKISIKNILKKLAKNFDIPFTELENYFIMDGLKALKRRSFVIKTQGKKTIHTFKIVNIFLNILKSCLKEIIYIASTNNLKISKIVITGYPLKFKDFKKIFFDPLFLELNFKVDPWDVEEKDLKTIKGFLDFLKLNLKRKHVLDLNFEPYEILHY